MQSGLKAVDDCHDAQVKIEKKKPLSGEALIYQTI
jgi:hypothetical protein